MASELFREEIGKTSNGYKVILSYDAYNDVTKATTTKYAEIDVQEGGLDVKSNVDLTSFPTLKGHNISDHIYRQPVEIGIKGEFADNGLKAYDWVGEDRLTRIQSEFEACQRAGVKFNIVTIKNSDASDRSNWRFLIRHNMVLTAISWVQYQHSLQFSFNFKEAISSNLHIVETKMDVTDPNLPAITDLSAASLVGEVISSNDVISMTIEVLRGLNLITDETLLRCISTAGTLTGFAIAGVGIAVTATVATVAAIIAGASTTVPVVGWVVGAAMAVVAGICAVFEWSAAQERAKQIEYFRSLGHVFLIEDGMTEEEKDEVVRNFITFLAEVKDAVDNSLRDISVYRIAKADRQECALLVNGSYYVQRIEKNDDDLSYRIECRYLGQQFIKSLPKIVALESFADCTSDPSAVYFYDEMGIAGSTYRVYIVNRVSYKQTMQNEETTEDKLNDMSGNYLTDSERLQLEKEQLLDFAFVVAPYPLTKLTDKIAEVIRKKVG